MHKDVEERTDLKSYYPVSLLSVAVKVLEKQINEELFKYLEK